MAPLLLPWGSGKREVVSTDFDHALTQEILRTELIRIKALIGTAALLAAVLWTFYFIEPQVLERLWRGGLKPSYLYSILVPFILFELWVHGVVTRHLKLNRDVRPYRRYLGAFIETSMPTVALALACYVGVFLGLRLLYGAQDLMLPYGHKPGLDILAYNLLRSVTFEQMLATLGVIPLVAALGYRQWPATLRAFFWTLVPLWLVIHAGMAVLAETRLLLVPQALVLIPAALFACGFKPAAEPAPAPARRSARKRQPRLEVGE